MSRGRLTCSTGEASGNGYNLHEIAPTFLKARTSKDVETCTKLGQVPL